MDEILIKDGTDPSWYSTQIILGSFTSDKLFPEVGTWMCFEPTMPNNAIIDAVRIDLKSNGDTGSGGAKKVSGGFIVRDGIWDATNGMKNYTSTNDMPMAMWDDGLNTDTTVWWDSLPAFDDSDNININGRLARGTAISLGDGIASTNPVPGLVLQLQSYWDDPDNVLFG